LRALRLPLHPLRLSQETEGGSLACVVLGTRTMTKGESWTIPFHVVEWTAITIGFIMAMVVMLMN
jgi:hypothetical protein